MSNLFAGLESLGLKGLKGNKLYEDDKEEKKKDEQKQAEKKEISEEDMLFDKTMTCPVCDRTFAAKTVRTGKPKLLRSDSDLRPVYQGIDTQKYDAVSCAYCGYSALTRYFGVSLTSGQLKLVRENMKSFSGLPGTGATYTYDEAILRYKLALACAVIKRGKASEKALTCLKLCWLFRGKREELEKNADANPAEIAALKENENEFLQNAYDGFVEALAKENFPMCGMDEMTINFLVANLAEKLGKYDDALKLVERIIMNRNVKSGLKDKAVQLKEIIQKH